MTTTTATAVLVPAGLHHSMSAWCHCHSLRLFGVRRANTAGVQSMVATMSTHAPFRVQQFAIWTITEAHVASLR